MSVLNQAKSRLLAERPLLEKVRTFFCHIGAIGCAMVIFGCPVIAITIAIVGKIGGYGFAAPVDILSFIWVGCKTDVEINANAIDSMRKDIQILENYKRNKTKDLSNAFIRLALAPRDESNEFKTRLTSDEKVRILLNIDPEVILRDEILQYCDVFFPNGEGSRNINDMQKLASNLGHTAAMKNMHKEAAAIVEEFLDVFLLLDIDHTPEGQAIVLSLFQFFLGPSDCRAESVYGDIVKSIHILAGSQNAAVGDIRKAVEELNAGRWPEGFALAKACESSEEEI
jgi:hypothetical protein